MSVFQKMLGAGGYLSLAIAAAHLLMIIFLKQICEVLGTPSWIAAMLAEGWTGWARLSLMIAGVAAFVMTLGLYGLSGAGRIRRLPLLRTGLFVTAAIFLFRATDMIGEMRAVAQGRVQGWASLAGPSISLFALAIGLLYLVGTIGLWHELHGSFRQARKAEGRGA